jgi:hypothetical protein
MFYVDETNHIQARVLNAKCLVRREIFDAKNKEHLASFKHFLDTGAWGTVQFFAEGEHISVPETVLRKYSNVMLNRALK